MYRLLCNHLQYLSDSVALLPLVVTCVEAFCSSSISLSQPSCTIPFLEPGNVSWWHVKRLQNSKRRTAQQLKQYRFNTRLHVKLMQLEQEGRFSQSTTY